MCKFYSAIVTREGKLLHNKFLTSHEDLVRYFNLNEGSRSIANDPNFIRVEFYPVNDKYCDIKDYKLEVDESSIPEWFDKYKKSITKELTVIVKSMIRLSENISILAGDVVIIGQNTVVDKMVNSHIIYMENSTVNDMWENSTVNDMWENSTVKTMRENSTVKTMRENSTVKTMCGNSTVNDMWGNSTVKTMRENSTVNDMWENSNKPVK
jgi:hypothetical protein